MLREGNKSIKYLKCTLFSWFVGLFTLLFYCSCSVDSGGVQLSVCSFYAIPQCDRKLNKISKGVVPHYLLPSYHIIQ